MGTKPCRWENQSNDNKVHPRNNEYVFIKFSTDLQTHLNPLLTSSKKHSTTPRVLSNSFSILGYINNIPHTSDLHMVQKVELSENTDS